jgi:hypothetical protein
MIHWQQQKELFYIFFYLWYLTEWFIKLFKHGKKTYKQIGFEQEANFGENDERYWIERKPYAWTLYL